MVSLGRTELAEVARDFVAVAFDELREERVIPTPRDHPYIRVGRDYYGPFLMPLPEFKALETLLDATYPSRFSNPQKRKYPEFASQYMFSFIQACVLRCAEQDSFDASADAVSHSIEELITLLDAPSHTVALVRAASHVSTRNGAPVNIGDIEIVPQLLRNDYQFFLRECRARIPGAGYAYNRDSPSVLAYPYAVLCVRASVQDSDTFGALETASTKLNGFMLALRLLTGTTARALFDVRGPTTLIGHPTPEVIRYQPDFTILLVRRIAQVNAQQELPLKAIEALLEQVQLNQEGVAITSFAVALSRFNASFASDSILILVDLATALEAVLIDSQDGTANISTSLRNRAATLLNTNDDSAANIFNDVKVFYDLRSRLVHGSDLTEKQLHKKIVSISTVDAQTQEFGVAAAQAVDRMRDLVRRAILARLCLATGNSPIWPLNSKDSIEVNFTDDTCRRQMREYWREVLNQIGAEKSWQHLAAPRDILREDFGHSSVEISQGN